MNIDKLIQGVFAAIDYQARRIGISQYNLIIKSFLPNVYTCTTCGSVAAKNHNDFQVYLWNEIQKVDERYIPTLDELKSLKYNTSFYRSMIIKNSFDMLSNLTVSIDNDIKMLRKSPVNNNDKINDLLHDVDVIRKYIKIRFNYKDFLKELTDKIELEKQLVEQAKKQIENNIVINQTKLIELDETIKKETRGGSGKKIEGEVVYKMSLEGKTLQNIADELDVNKSTVSKAISKYKKDNNLNDK